MTWTPAREDRGHGAAGAERTVEARRPDELVREVALFEVDRDAGEGDGGAERDDRQIGRRQDADLGARLDQHLDGVVAGELGAVGGRGGEGVEAAAQLDVERRARAEDAVEIRLPGERGA